MKSDKGWLGRTLFLASMVVAVPVWADEPAPNVKAAHLFYDKGKEFAQAGEWKKAEEAFTEALKQAPLPKAAGQLGGVQVKQGNYLDGARNLEWFFQEDTEVDMEVKEDARNKFLVVAKKNIATVKLRVDPLDAEVVIDGVAVPANRLAWPYYLKAGEHEFVAKKTGFRTLTRTRKFDAGTEGPVELKLVAEPVEEGGPMPGRVNPLWIAGGAVSAVLVVTGIGIGIGAKMRNDQAVDARWANNKPRYDHEYGASTSLWTGAFVSVGVGVAVGVTTLVYALKGRRESDARRNAAASLVVVPTVGGVIMHVAW